MRRPLVLLVASLLAGRAAAQSSGSSSSGIHTVSCPSDFAAQLEYAVSVELGALSNEGQSSEVRITCKRKSVLVQVSERSAAKARNLDLSGTDHSVQARVVAVTVAELVRDLHELLSTPPARPSATPPAPEAPPPDAELEPEPQLPEPALAELGAFGQAAGFDADDEVAWGGGLRFKYLGFAPLRVALDFSALTYRHEVPLGSARLVAASLGARLGYEFRLNPVLALELGAGQRFGVARVTGKAEGNAYSGSVVGPWTASFGYGGFDFAATDVWRLTLDGELGWVWLPVTGRIQDGEDLRVDDGYWSLQLGVGAAF